MDNCGVVLMTRTRATITVEVRLPLPKHASRKEAVSGAALLLAQDRSSRLLDGSERRQTRFAHTEELAAVTH